MCNRLHNNSKPIKPEGFGWKIFSRNNTPLFCPDFIPEGYRTDLNGWVVWDNTITNLPHTYYDFGFCFFTNRKTAKKILSILKEKNMSHEFSDCEVKRIQYKGGMGKHIETNLIHGQKPMIALCKEFKILEGE